VTYLKSSVVFQINFIAGLTVLSFDFPPSAIHKTLAAILQTTTATILYEEKYLWLIALLTSLISIFSDISHSQNKVSKFFISKAQQSLKSCVSYLPFRFVTTLHVDKSN